MQARVRAQYAFSRTITNRRALLVGIVSQDRDNPLGAVSEENLLIWDKKRLYAWPRIGDDRRATRGGFEKAHAGRIACLDHCRSCEIEREPLLRIEEAVIVWREMLDSLDVFWPADRMRILGPRDYEAPRALFGERAQQAVKEGLPIAGICSEITKIPMSPHGFREIDVRID
jgi:hypothetical protein